MTLLDWFAGQALAGLLSKLPVIDQTGQFGISVADKIAYNMDVACSCYALADAMLAEKARREADHSGDANKMVQGTTAAANERWARFQDGIRIAFSPTGGWLAEIREGSIGYGENISDAISNLRARWEEKNVVPNHFPDATKTAKQPDAFALLRRFIDAVPEGFETSLLWDLRTEAIHLLDVVPDHSPDAGKMAALEATSRELVEFAERIAAFPLEEFGWQTRKDSQPLHGWNDYTLYVSDIKRARNLVAKHKGAA